MAWSCTDMTSRFVRSGYPESNEATCSDPALPFHARVASGIDNEGGLLSDTDAVRSGSLMVDIGNADIKERRRGRMVPIGRGGAASDYVPFYFAPRAR